MLASKFEPEKDFRPFFYSNSFDTSKTKLKRSQNYFEYLCSNRISVSIKRILNFIEGYSIHTHYGLFLTNGCLLISDLAQKLLKDEKTIKSHIEETILFFNENKLTISGKLSSKNQTVKKGIKQEYPIFNDLRLIKTSKGVALTYSLTATATQLLKTSVNKVHFFKLYAYHHDFVMNVEKYNFFEKDLSSFLFDIADVNSLLPNDLINKVFDLPPKQLKSLKLGDYKGFSETEVQLIERTKQKDISIELNSQQHYISMYSWVDVALNKTSESNFYYLCISKLINNAKSLYSQKKDMCSFEIKVSKVKELLQRTSKSYDNTAIKTYLKEVCSEITKKSDLMVDVAKTTKGRGENSSFKILVLKKGKVEIEDARQAVLSDVKVKKTDQYSIRYSTVIARKLTTSAFYALNKMGEIVQIDYVIFDDLIKNPKDTNANQNALVNSADSDAILGSSSEDMGKALPKQATLVKSRITAKTGGSTGDVYSAAHQNYFETSTIDKIKSNISSTFQLDENAENFIFKVKNFEQNAVDSDFTLIAQVISLHPSANTNFPKIISSGTSIKLNIDQILSVISNDKKAVLFIEIKYRDKVVFGLRNDAPSLYKMLWNGLLTGSDFSKIKSKQISSSDTPIEIHVMASRTALPTIHAVSSVEDIKIVSMFVELPDGSKMDVGSTAKLTGELTYMDVSISSVIAILRLIPTQLRKTSFVSILTNHGIHKIGLNALLSSIM